MKTSDVIILAPDGLEIEEAVELVTQVANRIYAVKAHDLIDKHGAAAVSKRPRRRSRSLPIKRTRCLYRHHLRAAASIIASTAPFTASSSIGSMSASSYAIACKYCSARPVQQRRAAAD